MIGARKSCKHDKSTDHGDLYVRVLLLKYKYLVSKGASIRGRQYRKGSDGIQMFCDIIRLSFSS